MANNLLTIPRWLSCATLMAGLIAISSGQLGAAQKEKKDSNADTIKTGEGSVVIHPVNHASVVLEWNGKTIYVDPVGGAEKFKGFPKPNLILVTDIHPDHTDKNTLKALVTGNTTIVAPKAVQDLLPEDLKKLTTVMQNGEHGTVQDFKLEAVPMYNLTKERLKYHEKGRGNGYVLTLGGKRIYFSGDTEDIPEMRQLRNIDVAFVCMNLPYTMTPEQAAAAVKEFKPKVVYPYHYRGSDLDKFKSSVGESSGIEVRIRDWYAKKAGE